MTKITTLDLNPFYRNAIGVDQLFNRIINQIDHHSNDSTNYPPYNIIKTGEDTFEVQVATAGFSEGEVDVEVKDNTLIVKGVKADKDLPEGHEYSHKGISARNFVRTFSLADYVEVTSAFSKNGILTVRLERHIPEALQPKSIAITYES
jgi:molecular chaperone IbpA